VPVCGEIEDGIFIEIVSMRMLNTLRNLDIQHPFNLNVNYRSLYCVNLYYGAITSLLV
jgi:hypothetical protein